MNSQLVTWNLKLVDYYITKNDWDKAWFAENAVYAGSKDLAKRTVWDRVLKDRATLQWISKWINNYGISFLISKQGPG